jgi:hypothetical protein
MSSKKKKEPLTAIEIAEANKKAEAKKKADAKKRAAKKEETDEIDARIGRVTRTVPVKSIGSGWKGDQVIQNENKIRLFFKKFKPTDTDSKLRKKILTFSEQNPYVEKETFQEILKNLPKDWYYDFAYKYINQEKDKDKTFNVFWTFYKDRPNIRTLINEYLKSKDDEEDDKEDEEDDDEDEDDEESKNYKQRWFVTKGPLSGVEKEYPLGEGKVVLLSNFDDEVTPRPLPPKTSASKSGFKKLTPVYNKSDKTLWKNVDIDSVGNKYYLQIGKIFKDLGIYYFNDDDDDDTLLKQPFKPDKPIATFKTKLEIKSYENCEKLTQNPPWVKNVTQVFVADISNKSDIKTIMAGFKITPINYKDTDWYPINSLFTNIICRSIRYWNDDNQSVTIIRKDKQKLNVRFAYSIEDSDDLIIQSREHFAREKDFADGLKLDKNTKIKNLMGSRINENIKKFGVTKLNQILSVVVQDDEDTKVIEPNSEYISKIIHEMSINSTNVGDFLTKLGEMVVFLKNKDNVFFERVKEEYYIPEILWTLTIEDKFPEVFEDPQTNQNQKNDAIKIIKSQILSEIYQLKENLYILLNPSDRVETQPQRDIPSYPVLNKWKSTCENKDEADIIESQKAAVVYYNEGGYVYCLNIWDIHDQLQKGEKPINKNTGNPLDTKFLDNFLKLYNPNKFITRAKNDLEKIPEPASPILSKTVSVPKLSVKDFYAPDLLKMIIRNIQECEEDLKNSEKKCKSFEDDEEKVEDEKKHVEDVDEYVDEKSSDEDADLDEHVDEKSSDEDEKSSDEEEDVDKSVDKSVDKKSSDETEKSIELEPYEVDSDGHSPKKIQSIKKGNICQYCEKKCIKQNIKSGRVHKTTIKAETGEYETIYFCKFPKNCFENYDFQPVSFKKTIKGGGRCSSADRD